MNSKRKVVAADEHRAQPEAHTGRERTSSFKNEDEEVKADDNARPTQEEKLLELMTGLAERMERLGESHYEKERIRD